MRKLRLLRIVLKRSGANKVVATFLVVYFVCAAVVLVMEPGINTYADALWFLWAVSLTVGLGDFTAITLVGRLASMVCSLCAVLTTAIITAVVVDYFNESRQRQFEGSLAEFLDKLEHLDELSPQELRDISDTVRKRRA
ncbi:MAG: potassium channel family protein [Coriobacteriales bacterium]|nr:potassium channel family protein [Coriobacteriales bacterium]